MSLWCMSPAVASFPSSNRKLKCKEQKNSNISFLRQEAPEGLQVSMTENTEQQTSSISHILRNARGLNLKVNLHST